MIGEAEQIVGAQARLHVFEGNVIDGFAARVGVAEIGQNLLRRRTNVDLGAADAERPDQGPGIGSGFLPPTSGTSSFPISAKKRAKCSGTSLFSCPKSAAGDDCDVICPPHRLEASGKHIVNSLDFATFDAAQRCGDFAASWSTALSIAINCGAGESGP